MPAGRVKKIIPCLGFGFVRGDDGDGLFDRTKMTTVDWPELGLKFLNCPMRVLILASESA